MNETNSMHYDTFEAWFDELESFSLRSERFVCDLERDRPNEEIFKWLRAAFDAGRESGWFNWYFDTLDVKTGVGKTADTESESRIQKLAQIAKAHTDYEYRESNDYWGDLYDRNFARLIAADCARIAYDKSGWCGAADINKKYGVCK